MSFDTLFNDDLDDEEDDGMEIFQAAIDILGNLTSIDRDALTGCSFLGERPVVKIRERSYDAKFLSSYLAFSKCSRIPDCWSTSEHFSEEDLKRIQEESLHDLQVEFHDSDISCETFIGQFCIHNFNLRIKQVYIMSELESVTDPTTTMETFNKEIWPEMLLSVCGLILRAPLRGVQELLHFKATTAQFLQEENFLYHPVIIRVLLISIVDLCTGVLLSFHTCTSPHELINRAMISRQPDVRRISMLIQASQSFS